MSNPNFIQRVSSRLWNSSAAELLNYLRGKVAPRPVPKLAIDPSELLRLNRLPPRTPTCTNLRGVPIRIVDAPSYLSMFGEIFEQEIYKFRSASSTPRIVDCGSNIGLSVIYFKLMYPHAKITAFEPDPDIYAALQSNIQAFGFEDVELRRAAIWITDGALSFVQDGSWGGHLDHGQGHPTAIAVPAARLRDILEERIDFLKLDIEGAEGSVISDCEDRLSNVENLFVEVHSTPGEPQFLHRILAATEQSGMRYHVKQACERPTPFIARETRGFDSQQEIFAYRH